MRKLLRQNLHVVKYALAGVSVQFFLVGVARASAGGALPETIDITDLSAEYYYFQEPQQGRINTGKVVSGEDNEGIQGVYQRISSVILATGHEVLDVKHIM